MQRQNSSSKQRGQLGRGKHLLPVLTLAFLSLVAAQQRPFYAPAQWDYPGVNPMYLQNTTTSTDSPSTSTTTVAATTRRPASRVRPAQPPSQQPTQTINRKRPIESTRRTVTSTGWSKPVKTRPANRAGNGNRVATTTRTTTTTEPFVDINIENRVREWPAERQPFWYLNREHIRDHINQ